MDDQLVQWIIGGGAASLLAALGGMRVEKWKAQREAKTAIQTAEQTTWAHMTESIKELRAEIKELKAEVDEAERQLTNERIECRKQIAAVRQEMAADFEQAQSKTKVLSKICLDQQIEMDRMGVEMSKLQRGILATVPGGRRIMDPPGPETERQTFIPPQQN